MPSKLEIVLSVLAEGMDGFAKASDHVEGLKKKTEGLSKATSSLEHPLSSVSSALASAGFSNASGHVEGLKNRIDGLSNAAALLKSPLMGVAVGVAAAVAAVVAGVASLRAGMDFAGPIQDQADALAMSTQAVQEWNYAAKQSGGSAEAITNSFSKLTKNIYDAQTGNKELAQTFKTWNISLTDTHGNLRDVESITNDTMRAVANIKDPIERAGVATELLGKGSKDLLPLLASGTEAMDAQRKAAGDMGQVLSDSAIKALDDAGDTMDAFNMSMKVANAELISNFAPALESLATVATKAFAAVGNMAQGIQWLIKGKAEFDAKMKESDAVTKEIQEWAALKKEYQDTIATQEALRKSGGSLFAPAVLEEAQAGLEAVNEQLHAMNAPKAQAESSGLKNAQSEAEEKDRKEADSRKLKDQKELNSAMKRLQADANKDQDASFKDAEENWKNSTRIKKEAAEAEKKEAAEKLARNKKLDSDLDRAQLANAKDETARRQLAIKQEQRDIDKNYKEQIKDAKGNALEIAKANEIKNLSMQASNNAYNEWFKQSELAKRDLAKSAANDTLSNATNVFLQLAEKNKAWGNAYKASAISQTLISTYQGAQSSYSGMAQAVPGPVGIALGFVAAALAVTAGLMKVNEIRKQNFASGTNGPLQDGTWGITGEMGPELQFLPKGSQVENHHKTTQLINNNQKKSTNLHVYIQNSDGSVSKKFERELRNGSMDYVTRQLKKKMQVA